LNQKCPHRKWKAGAHSTAGALLACDQWGIKGRVLAYLIASHHAGLYDWHSESSSLEYRLNQEESRKELEEAVGNVASDILEILKDNGFEPDLSKVPGGSRGFALWLRMLFSALVDADFLDTEAFMDEGKAAARAPGRNWSCCAQTSMPIWRSSPPKRPIHRLTACAHAFSPSAAPRPAPIPVSSH